MYKTISTLPYLAALLTANTIGLELVVEEYDESPHQQHTARAAGASPPLGRKVSFSGRKTVQNFSRRLSNAASSLNDGVSHLSSRRSSVVGKHERAWRPLFEQADRALNIRRLYPGKAKNRAILAPIEVEQTYTMSRRTSFSGALSVQETPSPVAELHPRIEPTSPSKLSGRHKRGSSVQIVGSVTTRRTTPMKRAQSFEISEDTGYGTMESNQQTLSSDLLQPETHVNTDPFQDESAANLADKTPTKQDYCLQTPSSLRPSTAQTSSTFSRGHRRAQSSVASLWDLDIEEPSPPPAVKRRPLQLYTRPPLPNFSSPPPTRQSGDMQAPLRNPTRPLRTRHSLSACSEARPDSSRRASINTLNRHSVLSSHVSETWDEDFTESAVEVPDNIRDAQASLRGHLWQLQHLSEQISELRFLYRRCHDDLKSEDAEEQRIWRETAAVLAIADQGDEENIEPSFKLETMDDDLVADILGLERQHRGKIRLDGDILDSLTSKAEDLIGEICKRWML